MTRSQRFDAGAALNLWLLTLVVLGEPTRTVELLALAVMAGIAVAFVVDLVRHPADR